MYTRIQTKNINLKAESPINLTISKLFGVKKSKLFITLIKNDAK